MTACAFIAVMREMVTCCTLSVVVRYKIKKKKLGNNGCNVMEKHSMRQLTRSPGQYRFFRYVRVSDLTHSVTHCKVRQELKNTGDGVQENPKVRNIRE